MARLGLAWLALPLPLQLPLFVFLDSSTFKMVASCCCCCCCFKTKLIAICSLARLPFWPAATATTTTIFVYLYKNLLLVSERNLEAISCLSLRLINCTYSRSYCSFLFLFLFYPLLCLSLSLFFIVSFIDSATLSWKRRGQLELSCAKYSEVFHIKFAITFS